MPSEAEGRCAVQAGMALLTQEIPMRDNRVVRTAAAQGLGRSCLAMHT